VPLPQEPEQNGAVPAEEKLALVVGSQPTVVLTGPVAGDSRDGDLGEASAFSVGSNSEGKKSERKNFHLHDGLRNNWRTTRVL